jgi:hypothetical protein
MTCHPHVFDARRRRDYFDSFTGRLTHDVRNADSRSRIHVARTERARGDETGDQSQN